MSRGASGRRLDYVKGVLATSNPVSPPQIIYGGANVSITIRQTPGSTGTLAGSAQVQVTDFGGGPGGQSGIGTPPLAGDWVPQGTGVALSGGAPIRISLPGQTGAFLRFVWTDAGSTTATLDAAITVTAYSDD